MQPQLDSRVRFAITHKRLIAVVYHGSARVAEPHDYGVQGGIERVFVYQLRALAPSGTQGGAGWRLLTASEIEDCEVLEQTFPGSRGRSHHKHLKWDVVYARVD